MFPYRKENLATQVFTLTNSFLFLCLQVLYISLLLFILAPPLLYKMYIFSFNQILYLLVVGLYAEDLSFSLQVTLKSLPFTPPLNATQGEDKDRSVYSRGFFTSDPVEMKYLKIEIIHWAVFLQLVLIFVTFLFIF